MVRKCKSDGTSLETWIHGQGLMTFVSTGPLVTSVSELLSLLSSKDETILLHGIVISVTGIDSGLRLESFT